MESVVKKEESVSLVYVAIGINILVSILFHGTFSIYGYSRESIDNMVLVAKIFVWATILCFPEFKDAFFIETIRRKLNNIGLTWLALLVVVSIVYLTSRFLFVQFASIISLGFASMNFQVSEWFVNIISFIVFVGGFFGLAYLVSWRHENTEDAT